MEPLVPLTRALDTFAFNSDPLGGAGVPEGLTDEVISIVEAMSSSPSKPFADAQSISESITTLSGKGIMDSQGLAETITYSMPTLFVLDGAAFNSGVL